MTTSTLHRRGMGKGLDVMNNCITREGILSMDKDCKLLLLPGNTETKEKKKKEKEKRKKTNGSKKREHSSTPQNSDDTEKKPQTTSLAHKTSPLTPPQGSGDQMTKVKVQARGENYGRRSRKLKDAVTASSGTDQNTPGEAPSQRGVVELGTKATESLRWEGVLEDPLAEERRLEVYRANRRQRYLAQRQALVVAAQGDILRKQQERDRPKEDKKAVALPGQDQ